MSKISYRVILAFFVIITAFFIVILSILNIYKQNYYETAVISNSYSVSLGKIRRNFFDANFNKLTGIDYEVKAVVTPSSTTMTAISDLIKDENKEAVLNKLANNETVTVTLKKEIECEGIVCVNVPKHTSSVNIAQHLIGYLDYENNGISGLEKVFNDELKTDKEIIVRYAKSGNGKLLSGIDATVEYDTYEEQSGIMLTIDSDIQTVAERAADKISKGAIIISNTKTGEILAMVSRPEYDVENLTESLEDENKPFVNRALYGYNVGSVFKPCVAIAGIDREFAYNCTGNTQIGGHNFNCHNLSGHGTISLENALKFSCNTFFYNFAVSIGADEIYSTALKFGFGQNYEIVKGLSTSGENFAQLDEMYNETSLANIAIGQGTLLASPVKMLNLYSAIANEGVYCKPTVVKGEISHGILKSTEKSGDVVKAIDKKTAGKLKEYLKGVVDEGTGKTGKPDTVSAAGKTATAETAQNYNHTWFCGFFPYENPQYTVVIFSECDNADAKSSAPIFKEIADGVTSIKNKSS